MALYCGFFDSEYNEETGKFDLEYDSESFTEYFEQTIGSGVCVATEPDSCKISLDSGQALVNIGYLFIRGYWLKIAEEPYAVQLSGYEPQAVVAYLNMGKKMIELEARPVADSYPYALCLGIVDPANKETTDTRYHIDICGVIDSAGGLSSKVAYAINYIENHIEDRLKQIEDSIAEQDRRVEAKIEEAQAVVNKLVPPPVGTIKFSASQDVGPEWLRCDGSFVNEVDYPELVAALGKLTPSADKFQLISDGEIGTQISNGVVYGGRMWVYSYATKKLYGVDLEENDAVREIELTSDDSSFGDFVTPSENQPIALSIVPSKIGGNPKIFLAQIIKTGTAAIQSKTNFLLYEGDFSADFSVIKVEFPGISGSAHFDFSHAVPYVSSNQESGKEAFYCAVGRTTYDGDKYTVIRWITGEENEPVINIGISNYSTYKFQRISFSHKNKGEAVAILNSNSNDAFYIYSTPVGTFSSWITGTSQAENPIKAPKVLNIAGNANLLFSFNKEQMYTCSYLSGPNYVETTLKMPPSSRTFVDAGAYLWGKDIYMIFVGTGIIFSRTLEKGSFGYLDTNGVLGTITQFGYLDYSQDENTLYLLGQDTNNHVKVAKMELNTLYDYANDGAWLPMIASDGIPAYIKATEQEETQ